MTAFFGLTLALSAALLFAVQPMAARAALPVLGGSPAVWNTSMVFFQAVVLAGYAAAHGVNRHLRPRTQSMVFLMAVVAGALALPPSPPGTEVSPPQQPLLWLLERLATQLALPCFALALASPLLQRWYARATGDSREPYSLYAASNAGSLGALLAYPALLEPFLDLDQQSGFWSWSFLLWATLIALIAALPALAPRPNPNPNLPTPSPSPNLQDPRRELPLSRPAGEGRGERSPSSPLSVSPPAQPRLLAWVALGAIPASLLQGCTLFLTTDVASVPLLWIIPLALYLATFIVAFARKGTPWVTAANRALPFLATALLYVILSRATQPVLLLIALHLAFLFLAGLVCHGRLVALRPAPEHLTAFYLALAVGGVLGGAFNAFVAPHLFQSVAEYPLGIALACAALPARHLAAKRQREVPSATLWARDVAWATVIAVAMTLLGLTAPFWTADAPRLRDALVFGLPAIGCCALLDHPRRLSLATGAAFLIGLWLQSHWSHTEHSERNFFGITRVTRDLVAGSHQIVHGNTIHGRQFQDPARRREPLTYYHRLGPLGSLFDAFQQRFPVDPIAPHVGVIGLGAGSMAAYARPGEHWTFFEIDPAVIRVARDPQWFTFLQDSQASRLDIMEGDARLRLQEQRDATFDLLVLDAFSSDAIPVHLLTREALQVYRSRLRPDGWLAVHISNRYLNLEPVVAALAQDAGLVCRSFDDTHDDPTLGKEASQWILMARSEADLGPIARRVTWVPAAGGAGRPPWTDHRAGLLSVFEWQ